MKRVIQSLSENKIAFIVIFLISFIFLFPAFLGFVDTPTDIRNIRMYPWRYHALDKKVENVVLWEANFPSEHILLDIETKEPVFNLKTLPANTSAVSTQVDWDKLIKKKINKLSDANYYISFDFKTVSDSSVAFDFGIKLVNNIDNSSYTPGVALTPISKRSDGSVTWYKAFYPLNNFLTTLKTIKDLNNYSVQIVLKNKSNQPSSVYIKNFKLACEDFSLVHKVHNHYNNDLIQMFTPLREYFSKSIKKGILPFWNHYILTGAEFLAEPQVGFFHPLYFFSYLLFDHFTAHEILTFICLLLSGIGAFLLARFWKLNFGASLLASLVYMFQPFNVTWFSYEHMIMNSACLPFLLLSYEKSINEKRFLNKHLLYSALLFGLIFISGHLQYIYYTALFFVFFVIFRFIFSQQEKYIKHVFNVFFVFGIAIMIGAIVLVPFLPLFHGSHRTANPVDLVRATSVPLKAFLGLLTPFYKGIPDWPLSGAVDRSLDYVNYKSAFARNYVYFGLLPFIFSLFAFRLIKNKLVMFFIALIVISLLISTGSPLFFVIRNILPGFKEMQHYRFLQIYSYCVPFLAGFGFQAISDYFSTLAKNKKILLFTFIFLISAFDLMYFSSYFVTWSKREDYKLLPKNGVLSFLIDKNNDSKNPFRVLPFVSHHVEGALVKPDIAEPNTLLPFQLSDVSGYSSFIPKDIYYTFVYIQTMDSSRLYSGKIFDLFSNINTPYPISNFHSKILDLLNVQYFLVPNFLVLESDKVKKIFSGDSDVYENKNYLPRVFFVSDYKVISDPKETIIALDSEDFNPLQEVILMSTPDVIARSISDEAAPKAGEAIPGDLRKAFEIASPFARNDIGIQYDLNKININAKILKPGFLILNNNLNENWKVKINGKEGRHFQANLLQRAVFLPKEGEYLIEFYYYPKRFIIGGLISCFALLIILSLGLYLRFRKLD